MANAMPRLAEHVAAGLGRRIERVNAGNVLNRNIFDPRPPVILSSNRIIECMRAVALVMMGTKKLGKPKWE